MLKVIGAADLPRVNQPSPVGKLQAVSETDKGKEVAANGDSLPQEESNQTTKVEQAVNQMNQFVQTLNRDLQFSVDEDSGRTVVKVLDTETKEVIRQIPSEELLRMATYLTDGGGLLLKVQA
ncbi:MAG: flagellar protein FlaG [Gammaproteobacteria bacterium]|nr:flagellar protein FlaG [Gammaproteobacteria bacterium]MBU2478060.1 flagellar protein FlaG [Gammaproteobacteria bacterium]